MGKFSNKVIFITGASSGIGAGLAREFARKGADLVLTARRVDRLESLAAELNKIGRRTLVVPCDVTRDGDLEKAVETAILEFGKLDVVVANAGFGVAGRLEKLKLEDYRRQFETNVFGVLRTIYATLDELKKNKGTLVLLGSVAGYISLPEGSPYSMSKFSIHALAQSITPELKRYGISVVLIAPGFVESEIQKVDNLGRFHPEREDTFPRWLKMPTDLAARKIATAILRKKREQVITLHGKAAVFLRRHFPGVISLMVSSGVRNRSEPKYKTVSNQRTKQEK